MTIEKFNDEIYKHDVAVNAPQFKVGEQAGRKDLICTSDGYPIATTLVMGKPEANDEKLAAWIVACLNFAKDAIPIPGAPKAEA